MSLRINNNNRQRAFTLFEVLVALAILSITMVAAIVTTDNVLEKTVYLEKKLLAHFAGMNVLNNYQLNMSAKNSNVTRENNGKIILRNQEFAWVLNSQKIDFEGAPLLQLEVIVTETESNKNVLDSVSRLIPVSRT